jgi:hypothetical protein
VKLPIGASDYVTLEPWDFERPYPPLGFAAISECSLGNGDFYGFYWPIGREEHEPLVGLMEHDDWLICPAFSGLDSFMRKAEVAGLERWVAPPSLEEDALSPFALYVSAREALASNDPVRAVGLLESAVAALSEFGSAQALLCSQYRRLGNLNGAFHAAIRAMISPPCFGGADASILNWLSRQKSCPPEFESDPIWKARHTLRFQFGGAKTNDDYPILLEAINAYIEAGRAVEACSLIQAYGELMHTETVSFQERSGFGVPAFIAWQKQVATQFGLNRVGPGAV